MFRQVLVLIVGILTGLSVVFWTFFSVLLEISLQNFWGSFVSFKYLLAVILKFFLIYFVRFFGMLFLRAIDVIVWQRSDWIYLGTFKNSLNSLKNYLRIFRGFLKIFLFDFLNFKDHFVVFKRFFFHRLDVFLILLKILSAEFWDFFCVIHIFFTGYSEIFLNMF